jgi:hypothetical protein
MTQTPPAAGVDLARIAQIGRAHRAAKPKPENPAWQNAHHDVGFLLGQIDRLLGARELEIEEGSTPMADARRLIVQLSARASELQRESERLRRELAHVQASHADLVARCALLRERPDLPADRVPAYRELLRLQGELAVAREALVEALYAPPAPAPILPYFVAAHGGFLVLDEYHDYGNKQQRLFTVADPRLATPFDSFLQADSFGKWATNKLYPPNRRWFAVFQPAIGPATEQN